MAAQAPYVPNIGLNSFPTQVPSGEGKLDPISGHGSPEDMVPAPPGTQYTDIDSGDVYLKMGGVQQKGWQKVGAVAPPPSNMLGCEGSPEGVIFGPPGSECVDVVTQTKYVKVSGTGKTGWQANGKMVGFMTVIAAGE